MMFSCDDDARCTRLFGNTAPLTAIKISWVEDVFRLIAMPPFFIGKRVRAKVSKKIIL